MAPSMAAGVPSSCEQDDTSEFWQDFQEVLQEIADARAASSASRLQPQLQPEHHRHQHRIILSPEENEVCIICGLTIRDVADCVPIIERLNPAKRRRKRPKKAVEKTLQGLEEREVEEEKVEVERVEVGNRLETIPNLAKHLFPHQKRCFDFLWRNVGAAANEPAGCIVEHAPGTGKTLLLISFIKSYYVVHPECCPLILAPKSVLQSWKREIEKWEAGMGVCIFHRDGERKLDTQQLLQQWQKSECVMVASYESFKRLFDEGRETERNILLQRTSLLILDEGHYARNKSSTVCKRLLQFRTHRRILLSGSLFQNNVEELRNLAFTVRSDYLQLLQGQGSGCKVERTVPSRSAKTIALEKLRSGEGNQQAVMKAFKAVFPALNGNKLDASGEEKEAETEKMRSMMNCFVDSYDGKDVLGRLPGVTQFVVKLRPSRKQAELLAQADLLNTDKCLPGLIENHALSNIGMHPVLHLTQGDQFDEMASTDVDPRDSAKAQFILMLAAECQRAKERLLVFCMHLRPLHLLKTMLCARFQWLEMRDMVMVHGSMGFEERQRNMDALNNPDSEVKIMLASTKACGEGVSMIGASRVVHLDIEWNPAVNKQATSRAFRTGQTKPVFVYRLLLYGSSETRKFNIALGKDELGRRLLPNTPLPSSLHRDKILHKLVNRNPSDIFVEIDDLGSSYSGKDLTLLYRSRQIPPPATTAPPTPPEPEKRGRGRPPRKTKTEALLDSCPAPEPAAASEKRGRGRPRKKEEEEEAVVLDPYLVSFGQTIRSLLGM